jgi:hypothetical protein
MINRTRLCIGAGVVMLWTMGAGAQVHYGQPIIIEGQTQSVSVHFMSSDTAYDGVLWLTGDSAPDMLDMPLFFNHSGALGFEHELGEFQVGDRLDFIYDVFTGVPDSFRTDDAIESMQFRWQWDTHDIILVEVDDVRLPAGDADYNDMRFEVRMRPVPAPGLVGGLAMAGVFGMRRRRCR